MRWVAKKNTVLVGFHERKSSYVADMRECHVVPRRISDMLMPLRALIESMEARDRLPQIELAIGDQVTALVLRNLEPVSDHDMALLRAFGAEHDMQWWLQPKGPDTIFRIDQGGPELAYTLPEFGVRMPFKPTDFTQVNHHINTVLVGRALRLLDVQKHETVIDWFCGLGNFTLPLATKAERCWASRAARRWSTARWTTPSSTAWTRTRASTPATCSSSPPTTWWRWARWTSGWSTRRARARSRSRRRWPS